MLSNRYLALVIFFLILKGSTFAFAGCGEPFEEVGRPSHRSPSIMEKVAIFLVGKLPAGTVHTRKGLDSLDQQMYQITRKEGVETMVIQFFDRSGNLVAESPILMGSDVHVSPFDFVPVFRETLTEAVAKAGRDNIGRTVIRHTHPRLPLRSLWSRGDRLASTSLKAAVDYRGLKNVALESQLIFDDKQPKKTFLIPANLNFLNFDYWLPNQNSLHDGKGPERLARDLRLWNAGYRNGERQNGPR